MNIRLFAIVLLCLSVSPMAFAQTTHVTWDHNANFAGFHTYMWQTSPNPAKGAWDQRIIEAIDKQLQARGLTKVNSNPDLWVVYSNSIQNVKSVVGIGYVLPSIFEEEGGPAGYATYMNKVGTLVVELADTKTKQLVWRGSASDTISDKTNKDISNLDKAVAKLFRSYPPKPKK